MLIKNMLKLVVCIALLVAGYFWYTTSRHTITEPIIISQQLELSPLHALSIIENGQTFQAHTGSHPFRLSDVKRSEETDTVTVSMVESEQETLRINFYNYKEGDWQKDEQHEFIGQEHWWAGDTHLVKHVTEKNSSNPATQRFEWTAIDATGNRTQLPLANHYYASYDNRTLIGVSQDDLFRYDIETETAVSLIENKEGYLYELKMAKNTPLIFFFNGGKLVQVNSDTLEIVVREDLNGGALHVSPSGRYVLIETIKIEGKGRFTLLDSVTGNTTLMPQLGDPTTFENVHEGDFVWSDDETKIAHTFVECEVPLEMRGEREECPSGVKEQIVFLFDWQENTYTELYQRTVSEREDRLFIAENGWVEDDSLLVIYTSNYSPESGEDNVLLLNVDQPQSKPKTLFSGESIVRVSLLK